MQTWPANFQVFNFKIKNNSVNKISVNPKHEILLGENIMLPAVSQTPKQKFSWHRVLAPRTKVQFSHHILKHKWPFSFFITEGEILNIRHLSIKNVSVTQSKKELQIMHDKWCLFLAAGSSYKCTVQRREWHQSSLLTLDKKINYYISPNVGWFL